MFIIEVWDRKKWKELSSTISNEKGKLEHEVNELNKLVKREEMIMLPVSKKYRVKKVKHIKLTEEKAEV